MLAQRLGLEEDLVNRISGLDDPSASSDILFDRAFTAGPTDPDAAAVLLAAAVLRKGQEAPEGRLKSSLVLLSRIVGHAPVRKTLGPAGRSMREELMPAGWKETMGSWQKFRYAWREGLVDLLDVDDKHRATVEAIDELTRLHATEEDPTPVAIQETWPSPPVTFALSAIGVALSLRAIAKESGWMRRKR